MSLVTTRWSDERPVRPQPMPPQIAWALGGAVATLCVIGAFVGLTS